MSYVEKEVSVKELREMYHTGKYDIEISTPDGFQKIGNWYDKGVLQMVRVYTPSYETTCAVNHLIQLDDSAWVQASELEPGAKIQTLTGIEPVLGVVEEDDAECYDFEVLHSNHRYYGDGIVSHNSGKSFICSGNIVKNAQDLGCQVVLFDSENALDEDWLKALGVDTSPERLLKISVSMIDDVAKTISEFMKDYKANYGDLEYDRMPKLLFVVDSLGMLLTPTDVDQFQKGDMKGDMGRKPKALTSLVRNTVNQIAPFPIGLVATNHTYASQDMFDPDDKISGGCLTAGHKVWMADGSAKNIEEIDVGDIVITLDGEIDVTETFRFDDKEVFEIELETGEVIQATGEHKFLTQTDDNQLVWKTLNELSDSDEILQVE